ncbi:hypothetical protein NFI96_015455, partial [Prochilodus magdalenae]
MASSFVPVDNTRKGFTIVTQVVPGGGERYGLGTGGGVSTQGPLKKLLKGEPKALGTVQIMIRIMTFLFTVIKRPRKLIGVCISALVLCRLLLQADLVHSWTYENNIVAVQSKSDFYRFVFRMASSFVPVDNTKNGFTIVTQAVPGGREQYGLIVSTQGPSMKFLKGEPKALGTVQIIIGIMTFLFGIVKTVYLPFVGVISGVTYWGSFFYITSGSLSVAAAKRANRCVVTSSLIMNVISAVAAGIALVLLSIDMAFHLSSSYYPGCPYGSYSYRSSYPCDVYMSLWGQSAGISGVLVVFALLEFIISICTSAFACKVTCCAGAAVSLNRKFVMPAGSPLTSDLLDSISHNPPPVVIV